MSRLEELIKELCPNGVEYKKLGEIGSVCMCKRIMKNQTNTDGGVPFYKIGTFGKEPNAYITQEIFEEYKRKYSYPKKGDILISAAGTIGRTVVFDGNPAYYQDSNIVWVDNDEKNIENSFLYCIYQMQPWKTSTGGTISRLYNDNISNTEIPVPPIEVQREIVRILDNLTEHTEKLIERLTEELTARQKQYEYYRDSLFIPDEYEFKKVKLNSIAQIYDGTHQTPKYTESGIKFISVENIKDIYNSSKYISVEDFEKYKIKPQLNDVFMTRIGSVGKCSVFDKEADIAYYVSLALIRPDKSIVNSRFLKHVIESGIGQKELRKRTLINAVPIKINKDDIGKIELPIPTISEQEQIVNVLDRFDLLCTEISESLLAEIEGRKKQYEYYREKLLTFKELEE